jgi:hypothetical protein
VSIDGSSGGRGCAVSWFLSVPVNVGIKLHCDFVVCSVYVYICFSHMNYHVACAYACN